MTPKHVVSVRAFARRRRIVASAIAYGLSLAVRFTPATGEEVKIQPQFLQRAHPAISNLTDNGTALASAEVGRSNAAESSFFHHLWPPRVSSRSGWPFPLGSGDFTFLSRGRATMFVDDGWIDR
ncbi:hypothetical protein [Bradyrhizobium uaiense]|uniref:Uncharacterized protein n=1 Tax=Bradyrhizobium uaiense TaxID=2594946 RepID=A0A6P1BJH5_9BRAD|nr:hypothetical protein [Bradyrhizobium uaiense]NEU98647.1 hypothetical protein [Bradyrhizobium uaiense]